jgi:transcriptional regulator with XRE-family HTH domain
MNKFGAWLKEELTRQEMSQSDLARASNITTAQISRIISGNRGVGEQALNAIAHALKLPPEMIFEKAGLLPQKIELSPIKRKLLHLAEGLPDSDIETAIAILEQRELFYKKNPSAKPAK